MICVNTALGWLRENPLSLVFTPLPDIGSSSTIHASVKGWAPQNWRAAARIFFLQLEHCELRNNAGRTKQRAEANEAVKEGQWRVDVHPRARWTNTCTCTPTWAFNQFWFPLSFSRLCFSPSPSYRLIQLAKNKKYSLPQQPQTRNRVGGKTST